MNLLNIFKFVLLIFFIFFKALLADQINPLKIKETIVSEAGPFFEKMDSDMNVRFSVPNAVDTSELSAGKNIQLTFSSQKAIILPKGALAVD